MSFILSNIPPQMPRVKEHCELASKINEPLSRECLSHDIDGVN